MKNFSSRIIDIHDNILNKNFEIVFSADEKSRVEQRLDLTIVSFLATYVIKNNPSFTDAYDVCFHLTAKIAKQAGKNDAKTTKIDEHFSVLLLNNRDIDISLEQFNEFDVEKISDGKVDVSEIAVQYLSLYTYM